MAKFNVLSTKKLQPSLVERAKEQDIEVLEQEVIRIQPILTKEKWDEIFSLLEKQFEYAVFTSSNAVLSLKRYLTSYINPLPVQWKIFCLSGKTKETLVEDAELFGSIVATAAHAAELAQEVLARNVKEVLFFCGNKRRDELPAILQNAGVQVHELVVYETIETPLPVTDDVDAVLFFSPSAVQSFFAANQLKESTVCFAIGRTTADTIKQFTKNKVYTSKAPSQEDLLKEVINYFKNVVKSTN